MTSLHAKSDVLQAWNFLCVCLYFKIFILRKISMIKTKTKTQCMKYTASSFFLHLISMPYCVFEYILPAAWVSHLSHIYSINLLSLSTSIHYGQWTYMYIYTMWSCFKKQFLMIYLFLMKNTLREQYYILFVVNGELSHIYY